jgi:hypothetical protein
MLEASSIDAQSHLHKLPVKSGFRKLQSLQTDPLRPIHPGPRRRRFPPAKYTQEPPNHHKFTTYFVQKKAQFPVSTTHNSGAKPNRILQKPETHHNSPQKPNKCFIHRNVVGPLLLTFVSPERLPLLLFLLSSRSAAEESASPLASQPADRTLTQTPATPSRTEAMADEEARTQRCSRRSPHCQSPPVSRPAPHCDTR